MITNKNRMHHVAIMKKSWDLIPKILNGQKTIESRWYQTKRAPWNKIKSGDMVFFKNSGEFVTVRTKVSKVLQFENLTPIKIKGLLEKYGKDNGIEDRIQEFYGRFKNKKYCILAFLKNPVEIKPFNIDKTGFGAMSAWMVIDDINRVEV